MKLTLSVWPDHLREFELWEEGVRVGNLEFLSFEGHVGICRIVVEEGWRGQGLSVLLYGALKAWCQKEGIRSVDGWIRDPRARKARERVFGEPARAVLDPDEWDDSDQERWWVLHVLNRSEEAAVLASYSGAVGR